MLAQTYFSSIVLFIVFFLKETSSYNCDQSSVLPMQYQPCAPQTVQAPCQQSSYSYPIYQYLQQNYPQQQIPLQQHQQYLYQQLLGQIPYYATDHYKPPISLPNPTTPDILTKPIEKPEEPKIQYFCPPPLPMQSKQCPNVAFRNHLPETCNSNGDCKNNREYVLLCCHDQCLRRNVCKIPLVKRN